MAEFGQPGKLHLLIPKISQETLADMIGTTRSRVSFFMNRFRKLGFLEYNGGIHVNKALLNVVLHDQLSEQNAKMPLIIAKATLRRKHGSSLRSQQCSTSEKDHCTPLGPRSTDSGL